METITKAQLGCIKTLVSKLGADGETLALGCSGQRTEHVSKLSMAEAGMMIKELKKMDPEEKGAELMRRKLIGMAYKYKGLGARASAAEKQGAVNWLNGWCKKYGHGKKALNSYLYKELPMLVTQFEEVLNSLLKAV